MRQAPLPQTTIGSLSLAGNAERSVGRYTVCVGSPSAASIVTSAYGPSGTGGPGGSTARDVADGRTADGVVCGVCAIAASQRTRWPPTT